MEVDLTVYFCFYSYYFPYNAFRTILPIFLSNPAFEVGIPVSRANFCFACVIPKARFKENDTPGILNLDISLYILEIDKKELRLLS